MHSQSFMLPEKKKEISWELSFTIWQMPWKDTRLWLTPYVWTYIYMVPNTCLWLPKFLFCWLFHKKKSNKRECQVRWKTPKYPGVYLYFGRDKVPGDHRSDFQIYSSFGFTDNQEMRFLPHKRDSLPILFSQQRDGLIVSHYPNQTHL